MIKAYKNLAGYHELKDNDEKHNAEYVILTVDEYDNMVQDYKDLHIFPDNQKGARAYGLKHLS